MNATIDLTRELRPLYTASSRPKLVEVPDLAFVMIDGRGDPNTSPAYTEALEALYGVSYTLRFALKRRPDGPVFNVMPLEGLWWADDMRAFVVGDRDAWRWTMMIAQPDVVTAVDVDEAVAAVRRKRGSAALDGLRFECLAEGRLHRRAGADDDRPAPRDLPRRPAQGRAGAVAHDPAAAGGLSHRPPGQRFGAERTFGASRATTSW